MATNAVHLKKKQKNGFSTHLGANTNTDKKQIQDVKL